jgi:predicted short-subunit dehydrogenase-like oxidoreductase (DUF2520 family)
MNIILIGSGNVATHLGVALQPFFKIKQVYSQNLQHAEQLAVLVGAEAINDVAQLGQADVYILAVSDRAIQAMAEQIGAYVKNALVLHTSGSVDINVLTNASTHTGVLYPLQTFSKTKQVDFAQVPLLLEVAKDSDREKLQEIAIKLSHKIYYYSSAQRRSLHLAAVIACNFSNYLYTVANDYLDEQQVDFNLLKPLMLETAEKAQHHAPDSVQTGPAVRGDQVVLNTHIAMLESQPELQQVYALLSQGIMRRHQA